MEEYSIVEFCELVIEYFNNENAAGEYDGEDPRLVSLNQSEIFISNASRIINEEIMKQKEFWTG